MCLYEKPCPDSSDSSALFSDSSDLFPDIFDNYVSSVLCLESFIPSSDNSASSDSYVLWFEVVPFFLLIARKVSICFLSHALPEPHPALHELQPAPHEPRSALS